MSLRKNHRPDVFISKVMGPISYKDKEQKYNNNTHQKQKQRCLKGHNLLRIKSDGGFWTTSRRSAMNFANREPLPFVSWSPPSNWGRSGTGEGLGVRWDISAHIEESCSSGSSRTFRTERSFMSANGKNKKQYSN